MLLYFNSLIIKLNKKRLKKYEYLVIIIIFSIFNKVIEAFQKK